MCKCEFSPRADSKLVVGTYEGFITSVNAILQFKQQRMPYFTPKKCHIAKMSDGNSSMKDHLSGPGSLAQGFLHSCPSSCTDTQQGRAWRAPPGQTSAVPLVVLELGRAVLQGGTDRQSWGRGKGLNSITVSTMAA